MRNVRLSRVIVGVLAAALLGALAGGAGAGNQAVVKSAQNRILDETILVNLKGMTLYRLSGEKQGNLMCATPACFADLAAAVDRARDDAHRRQAPRHPDPPRRPRPGHLQGRPALHVRCATRRPAR